MSEESSESCVKEEMKEELFNPEEWIEWFDHFKDETGEWDQSHKLLKELTQNIIKDVKENERVTEESEEEEAEEEEKGTETELELEPRPRDRFEIKLHEFTEYARDYLMSKSSTLTDSNRPYRASNPKFWFYKEFREYLESQQFVENMVDVLVEMFDMHPELPQKPLSFIRDNYGISKKEEERLIAEWSAVSSEMVRLEDEGKALQKRLKWRLQQPRERDSTGSPGEVAESRRKKQPTFDEKFVRELSEEKSSSFHYVPSDPSSIPSSPMSPRPVGSEVTLLPSEEEQQPERSVTPQYEYDDFKRVDSSSSSLDIGSLELD